MTVTDPSTNSAWAYVVVGILSCITTITVSLISRRVAPKIKMRIPTYYAGYEKWAQYMESELATAKTKIDELTELVENFKEQLYKERQKNQQMRSKLLWFSRKYNVDVSEVVLP